MSESFEQRMKIFRENLAGMYDNGHMTKWADVDTSVDLDCLQTAHEHELEQLRKSRFHEGYVAGQRSMDAEHYAVALRLRALPLDGDTQENLAQIARAVWHSDFGWTQGACKALRDELVRLLGGVSKRPYTTSTYDVLGNERHEAVCRLREIRDCLKGDSTCNSLNIADAIGANLDVGDHLHESICDRLIHLLGGDEPAESLGSYLSRKSVEAMSGRVESDESGEVTITAELRERIAGVCKVSGLSGEKLYGIADRIDKRGEELAHDTVMWRNRAEDMRMKRDELQAKLDEAEFAIANWREREKSFDTSERMREELRQERDELRERLDRVADALRGVERGTMSAWEAADEVGR